MTVLSGATSLPESPFPHCGRRVTKVTSLGGTPPPLAPMLLITFKELLFLLLMWAAPVGFFGAVG